MRLIHSKTRLLNVFIADEDVPHYAILSHTWGQDEVTYQDMSQPNVERKAGYAKIKSACDQTSKDGLEWVWVDTCCIDKSSSAELSEAINSMFLWYQKADVCYAYLADVPGDIVLTQDCSKITKSRWFTRGWTLQELIAPSNVMFYSKDWHGIGSKGQLCDLLAEITGIDLEALRGQDLELFSVAKKMSWAAQRTTSRVEDVAYCLLGIFDVNMPLLYGEGKKAFVRLEEEILKISGDHSLFAWGMPPATSRLKSIKQAEEDDENQVLSQRELSSKHSHSSSQALERPLLRGILANSPADFANSGNIISAIRSWAEDRPPTVVYRGVRIELPLFCDVSFSFGLRVGLSLAECVRRGGRLAFSPISARIEDDYDNILGLALRPVDSDSFGRLPEPVFVPVRHYGLGRDELDREYMRVLHIKPEKLMVQSLDGNIVIKTLPLLDSGYNLSKVHCIPPANYEGRTRILKPNGIVDGALAAFIFHKQTKPTFAVVIGRVSSSDIAEKVLAGCVVLGGEKGTAENECLPEHESETEESMTESELLHSITHRYNQGWSAADTYLLLERNTYLSTSITRVESVWRKGAFVVFVEIKID